MVSANRPPLAKSLSARLLVLTVFFVLFAEFLIYAPSISRYRKVYLEERIASAHLASLALEATPNYMLSEELEKKLLFHAGAYSIVHKRPRQRLLMLSGDMPPVVEVTFDLRRGTFPIWIRDAFAALIQDDNRVIRVLGVSPKDPSVVVEVVLDEAPMRKEMYAYSARILELSIVISLFTAGLVYLSLQWLMVGPIRRITGFMTAFHEDPEDDSATVTPSTRSDEIGIAQRELAVMQRDIRVALRQKTRLAALGAAVAKINHDLRNSLSTAVLVSDHLSKIDDPKVKMVVPRLYESINRAVELCSQTLDYVGDGVIELKPTLFHLRELVAEVGSLVAPPEFEGGDLEWRNDVDFELDLSADREQLFRVFANLGRNARQAGAGTVRIGAAKEGERLVIEIADDGPGLHPEAREHLFKPFTGSMREGGIGLGLAIASDVMRAHGGDITLAGSGETGTTFRLELPLESPAGET